MAQLSGQFWELTHRQHGAIGHSQLAELGFSNGAIQHRLGDRFFRVHRGVYSVGRPTLSRLGRWMAAVLACGDDAALSHESGAALLGVLDDADGAIHVSVPVDRHPKHAGIRPHRRTPMPPTIEVDGIPVVEPLHILVDLARSRSPNALRAIVNEADKLGLIRSDDALSRIAELRRRPGIRKLHAVLAAHQVSDSDLERRFLTLCTSAGIPSPLTQAIVEGHRVDFYWPDLRLIVETDGLTYHRTPIQQAADRLRDQQLTAAGFTCLRFTNAQVRREREAVAQTMHAVVRRLRQR